LYGNVVAVSALIDRGIARLQGSVMVQQSALVFASTMVLNIGGFVFHAVVSRRLGVADYGIVSALISACTVAALPAALATPVVARFATEFRALHDDRHVRRLTLDVVRFFGMLGLAYVIAAVAFMGPTGAFLHVPRWTVPAIGAIGGGMLISAILRAIAQGTQDFGGYARSCIADGTTKVIAVVVFMLLALGLLGGVLAFFAGTLGGIAAIGIALAKRYRGVAGRTIRYDWKRIAYSMFASAAITLAAALIGSADVILVKHFFSSEQAGIYAAATLGGKVLLYFVGFVPTVLLPQATERHVRGERTRYALAASVGVLFGVAAVGLIGLRFFGPLLLHALVGHAFDSAIPLLLPYSIAMMFLALSGVLGSYGIATHRIAFAFPLIAGVLSTLAAILFAHATLIQVVHVLAVGNGITATAVAIAVIWQGLHSTRRPAAAA
jgi:O-antigen/teichoic acid export membrane protein